MNQMNKKRLWTAFLVAAILLLAGCGKSVDIEETGDSYTPIDKDLIVVGVSQIGS